MSQPDKTPEPSIDEILASIRRSIVPDDDAAKPIARKQGSRKSQAAAKGRRGDAEAARAGQKAAWETESGGSDGPALVPVNGEDASRTADRPLRWDDTDSPPGPHADATAGALSLGDAVAADRATPHGPLLSPRTSAAVDTAFSSLSQTVLSQSPRTLEDLVRDMLRPMLKEWLDANLPHMVERLVRAEIERVSRRG